MWRYGFTLKGRPTSKGEPAPLATAAIGGPPYAGCLVIIGSETEPGRMNGGVAKREARQPPLRRFGSVVIAAPLGFALRTISESNSDGVIGPPDDAAPASAVIAAAESQQKFVGECVGVDVGDFCAAVREVAEDTQTRLLLIQIVDRGRGMPFDPEVLSSLVSHGICSTVLHNVC